MSITMRVMMMGCYTCPDGDDSYHLTLQRMGRVERRLNATNWQSGSERGRGLNIGSNGQYTRGQSSPDSQWYMNPAHQSREKGSDEDDSKVDECTAICSAFIYDDLFRQVRVWARMGYSAEDIQYELDVRFRDIIDIETQVIDDNNLGVPV